MGPSQTTGDERQDLREKDMLTSLMSIRLEQLVKAANDLNRVSQSVTLNRRHFVQKIIVAGGVSLVIVILINIYLIRKSVVRPLKVLSNGAERIGAGNFNYVAEIMSDDEVGKLAQAFNTMIERLGKRDMALTEARDELEFRVEKRTAELRTANDWLKKEIEERERAEEALLAAGAYNRSLIEASLDPLVTISAEGKITDVNTATEGVTGYSRSELVGADFANYFTDTEKARLGYQQVFRDGSVRDYELEISHKNGWLTPVIYNASLYRNESGEIAGVFAAARDISDRKRAEAALQTASAYNRSLIEASLDPLVTISAEGKITDVNTATERVTGCSRDELIGRDFANYFTDPEKARIGYEQVFRDGSVTNYELAVRHKGGGVTPVMYNASIYRDDSGKVIGIFAAARDITDRKRAEEELIRSNEDLQQFAYVASHDLQEPLRNVASCLQLLDKKYKNNLDAKADQLIHYAVESSVRMKALILDLLAYSRVGTKGKPPKQTDCEQLLDQAVKNLRSAISEAGAVITHDPLPTIPADDAQLLQVFQNLIGNSIKFRRDEPPQIHVSAVKNKKEWVFTIKDNGIGIESRHLDRIFMIFQRLHKRSQYGGTGIGLAIVKKVVERHNGRVWVESEFGGGTTFYFAISEKGIQA